MAELDFGKSIDDIEEPELLTEGWRTMQLVDEPKTEDNNALKQEKLTGQSQEKAGHNWSLRLAIVDDEPQANGRTFFLRFPIPREKDKNEYTNKGQKVYDAKMQRIVDFVQEFGGYAEGTKVKLTKGAKGMCYVLQAINQLSGQPENQIDIFNQGFKSLGGSTGSSDGTSF